MLHWGQGPRSRTVYAAQQHVPDNLRLLYGSDTCLSTELWHWAPPTLLSNALRDSNWLLINRETYFLVVDWLLNELSSALRDSNWLLIKRPKYVLIVEWLCLDWRRAFPQPTSSQRSKHRGRQICRNTRTNLLSDGTDPLERPMKSAPRDAERHPSGRSNPLHN